ncbi:hypothetical protein LCGC14_2934710 [marine sediment metagenome]|uniref:Uncharacterized protein n=1 Tax=marine sediment metagenome TaxID=412755 RepID=A0A0F9AAX7_9ZZZZ
MSNAERQRRYRDKHRNAQTVTDEIGRVTAKVTPEDGSQSTNADKMVIERGQRTRTVPIPGDDDYVGVCECIAGEWVVVPDPPAPVSTLSDVDLQLKLKSYRGASWVGSPEHKDVLRRRQEAAA